MRVEGEGGVRWREVEFEVREMKGQVMTGGGRGCEG